MTKQLLLLLAIIIMAHIAKAQAKIGFESTTHDYGQIYRNDNGNCRFAFKNTGNAPLLITKVVASCGCTVPSYPKTPVMPGQSETINVTYNTKNTGVFSKTVNVYTNDPDNQMVVLTVKGEVKRK